MINNKASVANSINKDKASVANSINKDKASVADSINKDKASFSDFIGGADFVDIPKYRNDISCIIKRLSHINHN